MKTVDKYIKKELKYYYKKDKQIIDDFINNSLDHVDSLVSEGMSVELANKIVIDKLSDLSDFKQSLTKVNEYQNAKASFIFSIGSSILIFAILLIVAYLLRVNILFSVLAFVGVLFWPLSMWKNLSKKRDY